MRLKQILIVLAIAVAVSLYIKFFGGNDFNDKPLTEEKNILPQKNAQTAVKEVNKPQGESDLQNKLDQLESRFPKGTPDGWDERRWRVYKSLLKRCWIDIKDIDYYCVVLNQFQEPVKDAEVTFELTKMPEDVSKVLETKKMSRREKWTVKVRSDEMGLVNLTNVKADSFSVIDIVKEGYSYVPAKASYLFWEGREMPAFSPEAPVKLYIMDETKLDPLYKKSFYKDLKYNDIWEIDILRRNKKGPTSDQVNLSISCRQLKEQYDTNDWELMIDPVEGSEVALTTKASFLAKGLSSNKVIVKNEDIDYKNQIFIFYHNISEDFYSKIKIDITGDRREPRICIYSFSNPIKGSKNLSYLKEKELKKWPGVIDPDKK